MTTTDSLHTAPRPLSSNNAILKLERVNKNLLSLRTKLSSYMCEPKTLSLYQRMDTLKRMLEESLIENKELIQKLHNKTLFADESKEIAQSQFESYKKLELKVLEYIGMARMHC